MGTGYYIQADEQWTSRHQPYHRLDLRINRYIRAGHGRLNLFVEMLNLLGRDNVRGYDYELAYNGYGGYAIVSEEQTWLPRLPSVGIAYELTF